MYTCAKCAVHACMNGMKNPPKNCPGLSDQMDEIIASYQDDAEIAKNAAELSTDFSNTRIEETMIFLKKCGYRKIGIAFCAALANESKIINDIFLYNGFETESLTCKIGGISMDKIGVENCPPVPMCNPIAQAKFLNEAKTEYNVIVGLCVGHDSLFIKYSEAPVTVLAVKDRVLGNNPLGAIYTSGLFYKNKLFPPKENS